MRRLNKKGQSTAEYAIVIGLIIGAVIGMQTYVKRGVQARVKDAVDGFATRADHKANFGAGDISYNFTDYKNAQIGETAQGDVKYLKSRDTTSTIGTGTTATEQMEKGGKVTRTSTTIQTREVDETYDYQKVLRGQAAGGGQAGAGAGQTGEQTGGGGGG
ncbi:MAG: hypothetical protein JSV30_06170 [Candidatus Omnitrophota bacterium]|nr:MAG: hypothetical protein JSV30_06170 [Candidatus Omnitrophota bacterium]